MLPEAHEQSRPAVGDGVVSVRCMLGLHTAQGVPRWNDGYYFAKCARCRVDLVRTAFDRWHVPHGHRVIWQAEAPASRPEVRLEPELDLEPISAVPAPAIADAAPSSPAAAPAPSTLDRAEEPVSAPAAEQPPAIDRLAASQPPPAVEPPPAAEPPAATEPTVAAPQAAAAEPPAKEEKKRTRLPVEALFERLRGTPPPAPAPPALPVSPEPPEPPEPPTSPRPLDWDFMMEPAERKRSAPPEPVPVAAPVEPAPKSQNTAVEPRAPDARNGPSIVTRGVLRLRRRAASAFRSARHNKRFAQSGAVAMVLAALVASSLWFGEPASPGSRPVDVSPVMAVEPPPEQQPETSLDAGEPSFVTARALSCRDAPALQARRVRVLARGASVRVLARDGDWVSLATARGQCWADGRYVAEPQPL
jgi:hypothetical protein